MFTAHALAVAMAVALPITKADGPIRERLRELKPSPPAPEKTLAKAIEVLAETEQSMKTGIPEHLMAKAEGVVVIPDTVKAGFIVAGRGGHGVALVRGKDGLWGDPTFVNLGGVSFGPQLGVQATDLVLVFKNKKTLERILDGKGKITLGVDAGVAAGPVGRRAEAGTDAQFKAEVLSYSKTRGLFAGVSLDGGVLDHADAANRAFVKEPTKEALQAAENLKAKLLEMGGVKADKDKSALPPAVIPDSPPVKKDK
jgi:lipid-binding SYLF domain-containing protein